MLEVFREGLFECRYYFALINTATQKLLNI